MVDLGLSAHVADGKPPGGISVAPRAWLVIGPSANVWQVDLPHLLTGLRRIVPRLREVFGGAGGEFVFVLEHLWYPLTDSQSDAIELAVAGWAVEEMGIPDEPATVSFDRFANRYVIEFNEDMWGR
jgi:hypothetical protein